MATPLWFNYPVTQGFDPTGPTAEVGMDFADPFHTKVTAILPGTVLEAASHPWGGEVDIAAQMADGTSVKEVIRHLDTWSVKPGDVVQAGQQVGLSGGQLGYGANPAQQPYSSGPHMEFALMGPTGSPIDPSAVIGSAAAGAARGVGSSPFTPPVLPGVNINFPDIGASFSKGLLDNVHAAQGWFTGSLWDALKGNIVPLVVAAAILVVILGNGSGSSSSSSPPAPKPVVVPV